MKKLIYNVLTKVRALMVLFTLVVIASLFLSAALRVPDSRAQSWRSNWGLGVQSVTNVIPGASNQTANIGSGAVLLSGAQVIEFAFTGLGASVTNGITLTFTRSIDGVNWATTPTFTWVVHGNGTTDVWARTNWTGANPLAAYAIKCTSINNASNTAGITNITLRFPSAPP